MRQQLQLQLHGSSNKQHNGQPMGNSNNIMLGTLLLPIQHTKVNMTSVLHMQCPFC